MTESRTIRIDSEVFQWLQSHGKGFETPNTALRRVAGLSYDGSVTGAVLAPPASGPVWGRSRGPNGRWHLVGDGELPRCGVPVYSLLHIQSGDPPVDGRCRLCEGYAGL